VTVRRNINRREAGMAGKVSSHIRSNVVGYIALFFALGLGSAWAATELSKNEVKSKHIKNAGVKTKDLANNSVTSPKVADGSLLGEDFAPGQLPAGEPGPPGERGAPGEDGEDGEDAADLWATVRVNADGSDLGTSPDLSIVRSKGTITNLQYAALGTYRIDFAEIPNASEECAYNATLADVVGNGSTEVGDTKGEIMTTPDSIGQISVLTFDSTGTANDPGHSTPTDTTTESGFHLTVNCP
jgi:hypothetical protein